MSENDSNNRNLIQFPTDRIKNKNAQPNKKTDLKTLAQDPRKAGAVVSILSVILLSMYFNPGLNNLLQSSNNEGRGIASVGDSARDPQTEQKVEKEFLGGARYPASVGREPSAEDRLRVGDLHGRYRLVYRDEYVSEIALIVDKGNTYDPIVLADRKEFLERYKKIIHPTYDTVEPKAQASGDLRDEFYVLKRDGQAVGLAPIKLDKFGRFYSMNVE
jgi:hypothetical protein